MAFHAHNLSSMISSLKRYISLLMSEKDNFMMGLLGFTTDKNVVLVFVICILILLTAHIFLALVVLFNSYRAGKPAFKYDRSTRQRHQANTTQAGGVKRRLTNHLSQFDSFRSASTLVDHASETVSRVIEPIRLTSKYFDLFFNARTMAIIGYQSYQSVRLSQVINDVRVIRTQMSLTSLNCVCAALIMLLVSKNQPLQRLLFMMCDLILTYMSLRLIPELINNSFSAVPDLYNPIWVVGVQSQIQTLLVNDGPDMLSRVLAMALLIISIEDIKFLLREEFRSKAFRMGSLAGTKSRGDNVQAVGEDADTANRRQVKSSEVDKPEIGKTPPALVRLSRVAQVIVSLYGFVVLGFHFRADHVTIPKAVPGCHQILRPWFDKQFACTVYEINCVERNIDSSAQSITTALGEVDKSYVNILTISHCPQVEMPATLQEMLFNKPITAVSLAQNPLLTQLPVVIGTGSIGMLSIQRTKVMTNPAWLTDAALKTSMVMAAETPLCANTSLVGVDPRTPPKTGVDCIPRGDLAIPLFPLAKYTMTHKP